MVRRDLAAALLAVGIATTVAQGEHILPPGFNITCQVNGGPIWNATANEGDFTVDPTTGAISGASQGAGWSAEWDSINFSPNGSGSLTNSAALSTAWSFTNNTGSTQLFTITFTSPIPVPFAGATTIFGSITGGLTANSVGVPAQFWAPAGGSVYTALVNGSAVAPTLMDDPFHKQTTPPTQTAPLGFENFEFEPGPFGASNNMSIQHSFLLTAGDSVTFNSAFAIIPAPAGLAVFAMFGLAASRRRRD